MNVKLFSIIFASFLCVIVFSGCFESNNNSSGEINNSIEGIWSNGIDYFEFHNDSLFYVWDSQSTYKEYYGNYSISKKGFIYNIRLDYTTDIPWWENPNKEDFDLDFVTVHNVNGETTRGIEIDGWSYDYYGSVGSYTFSSN